MDLLAFLGVAVLGGVVGFWTAALRPVRRVRLVFRCNKCGSALTCNPENAGVDELDPVLLPVRMGWQLDSDGRWACRAHVRAEA